MNYPTHNDIWMITMIQDSKANNSDTRLLLTSFACNSNIFFWCGLFSTALWKCFFFGGQIRDDSQSRLLPWGRWPRFIPPKKKITGKHFFLHTDKYQLTDLFFLDLWVGWPFFLSPYLENVVYLFFWKHVAGFSDLGVSS